ncbi:winged helix-turn-helix transcriptional regulator [Pseudomonas nicosulfuronedens]
MRNFRLAYPDNFRWIRQRFRDCKKPLVRPLISCPVAQALNLIGDSWNVLILREAFYGSTRFDQFLARLGIASNVLTRRLRALVGSGLLESAVSTATTRRLTERGRDLRPVLLTLLQWGKRHGRMASADSH